MARKKSLSEKLGAVVSALGASPPIPPGALKSQLVTFISEAEVLEGSGAANLEAQNETLKSELEAVKAELETNKTDSAAKIGVLRSELDRSLKEKAEREGNYPELPSAQFTILKIVPPASVQKECSVADIHSKTDMSIGDIGVHVSVLKGKRYIGERRAGYCRTNDGHGYIMAKRLEGKSGEDVAAWIKILDVLNRAHEGRQILQIQRFLNIPETMLEFLLCELENEALISEVWEGGYRTARVAITASGSRYLAQRRKS